MSNGSEDLSQIAVIGLAGRFPGAPDTEAFWANLAEGRESIAVLSDDELLASGVSPAQLGQPGYVKAKGVLADADLFDAGFFGYSPREAEIMDPQHRLFLECAWEALESAGCDPREFDGRISLFAGASLNSYLLFNIMTNQAAAASAGPYQTLIASDKDFLATRVSYKLDLKGPSITVQTACSTSLTAVHLACQSLLTGESDIALAGGVSVSVPLTSGYVYEPGGILSPDGHCRAFDATAGGVVAGNGAGIVVLRRLADAQASGDVVSAVIRGTAINNDGSLKAGYTAPSVDGQAEVIAEALAVAGIDAATVGYVETHGTGTALGDPIEIAALTRAFREHTDKTGYCAIGSVKTNVGHLDAAAGVTALIKTVLALEHEAIPASLHYEQPNPGLDIESSPFFVNTELRPWPRRDAPRRAGVSAFGIGGTNVHVVLEEAPAPVPQAPREPETPAVGPPPARLLPLSARTPAALAGAARRLADYLERSPDADLGAVARTLATRRRPFERRIGVVGHDRQDVITVLRATARPGAGREAAHRAPVAFLFPGQGAQYAGMTADLYRAEPVFTTELDRCAELFIPFLGIDLRALLFPAPGDAEAAARALEETAITQPAIFAVEYALARLWWSWGVRPRVMAGHSVGEYAAACLAGVFSLEDAVRLVAARGRIVQEMPRGAMLAVDLPEAEAAAWLGPDLCLAAANSQVNSVISGSAAAIVSLRERLTAAGVACHGLRTSHAFHSPDMDGAVRPFTDVVATAQLSAPRIPFCSSVTGTWITDEMATSPAYWGTHLRQTVRFADCLGELLRDPEVVLLEVGPGQALATFARQHPAWRAAQTSTGSVRRPKERCNDHDYLLGSLGDLWSGGVAVDWAALFRGQEPSPVRLPGYAFDRQRYWIAAGEPAGRPTPPAATAAEPADGGRFYAPGWKRLPASLAGAGARQAGDPGPAGTVRAGWVVLGAGPGIGRELAAGLAATGVPVTSVRAGAELAVEPGQAWSVDIGRREHYARLIKEIDASGPAVIRVVHAWGLSAPGASSGARLDRARRLGLDSLIALAQGIADARPSAPVAIDVLCTGVHSVTGEEELRPENALTLGACTVIPQEIANVTCRSLDVTGTDPDAPAPGQLRAIIAALIEDDGAATPSGGELALRGRHWWTRDFDEVRLPEGGKPRLRDGGVYLITGGLGGIGLEIAGYIARNAAGPVLGLLGRSALPAADHWPQWLADHDAADPVSTRIWRLTRLRELGACVVPLRADITDREQAGQAIGEFRDRFGVINGVVHAAGAPSRGLIAGKTGNDITAVVAAKTHGTVVLDEICDGADTDFTVLCSSLTAVLGGPGQSDYSAANAFLDAFAQWKRQTTGAPVTAVAWDAWRGVGMAAGLAARLGGSGAPDDLSEQGESRTYATTFSTANSWIVDEHRIQGHGLVPGTAYLELVRAAVADRAPGRVIELSDVLFTMPVIVPDGQAREVFTTIAPRDGRLGFTVRSRAGDGWQEHASGLVTVTDRSADTVRDLDALRRECAITEVIDTEDGLKHSLGLDVVEQGGPIQFAFGPRWRCLRRIEAGDRGLIVTLRLDEEFHADTGHYGLHPALLDVAGAAARIRARDVYYLPLTYHQVRVHSALTPAVYCHVRLRDASSSAGETLTCDMDLYDPDGRLLTEITGFTIKRINDPGAMAVQIARAATEQERVNERPRADPPGVLATLAQGMSTQDSLAAFGRILAAPALPEQILVAGRDLNTLRDLARSITPALLALEAERILPAAALHPRPDLDTPFLAPATDEQRAVAAIWADVLGVDQVGVHDDFFALGGHSLAAVQISAKILRELGVQLELSGFFDNPTVARTAELLSAARAAGGTGTPDIIPRATPLGEDAGRPSGDGRPAGPDELAGLSDEQVDARLRELLTAATPGGTPAGQNEPKDHA